MTVTHASFVTLPVSDQDRALRFYVDVLGFEVTADRQLPQGRWLQVAPSGAQTVFTLSGPGMGDFVPGSARGIMLVTTDVDADCARLAEAGAEVGGPDELPWGRMASFRDPDGNALMLLTEKEGF
ncbi:glyoxalase superfamily protein [Streptomyces sp. VRA16 Mangrove soil]|uniref:glyoxalase superfamily protein n=1 Tax=Streptomyces sp. VRA16 Mangrove soil TaxID=2817434 RepID=UPI001A9F2EC3|nr:glyoxalase superfamily protein [Streptomyces sp. VRA16 Mangrove soil]MBO1333836.1 VOC family protein [Streptomyces sp. VRA16 Mangrove soil]